MRTRGWVECSHVESCHSTCSYIWSRLRRLATLGASRNAPTLRIQYRRSLRSSSMGDTDASGMDFLLDAVAQFLQSGMWLDAVSAFLESNFRVFLADEGAGSNARAEGKVVEHSLAQYEAFTAFKDLVERLLEQLMADLGCSGEDLVAALEGSVWKEESVTGERRFFIKTLLSFDDYDTFCDKMTQYAAEKRANGLTQDSSAAAVELSEWKLQEVIARSILDAKALGQLDEAEEAWVPWAEALIQMTEQAPSAPPDEVTASVGADSKDSDSNAGESTAQEDNDGLRGLQQTLIRERLKVDLLVAQRIADGNASLKRQMLRLAAQDADQEQVAAPATDEDELAEQFKQVEGIRDRLKEVKTQCFAFTAVQQEQMDSVYLYLKEKVHYKQDLVAQEKDIAAFIFTHMQENDAALVPLMLEWLLLESELQRTQNFIQELLNGPQDTGYWTQQWDEASQALYYINSVSGESVWEVPQSGYYDLNQEFQWEPASGSDQEGAVTDSQTQDPSLMEATDASTDQVPPPSFEDVAQQLDAAPSSTSEAAAGELLEMESVLDRISREHDEERKRLELVFELEKARQKEELRKRKEKKRREKIAKKKKREAAREVKEDDGQGSERVAEGMATVDSKLEDEESLRQPPAPLLTSRLRSKADAKDERNDLSILIPGHGRVDLSYLLSDDHSKRHHKRKGTTPDAQTAHMMLHPTSLRFLAGQMIKRKEEAPRSARQSEIVLEELADEK